MFNFAPGFGKVRENVWSAMIQSGMGITKETMSRRLAADARSTQSKSTAKN